MEKENKAVAEKAYELWLARGGPHGSPEEDWYESERLLSSALPAADTSGIDDSSAQSFPASDPPASHLPDNPPDNAGDKWEAAGVRRKQ